MSDVRLINANALKEDARTRLGDDITSITILKLFEELIDNASPVEGVVLTEEAYSDLCLRASRARPQGKWERVGLFGDRNVIDCPFCGDTFCRLNIPNFCENCGAALRGEKNEKT